MAGFWECGEEVRKHGMVTDLPTHQVLASLVINQKFTFFFGVQTGAQGRLALSMSTPACLMTVAKLAPLAEF